MPVSSLILHGTEVWQVLTVASAVLGLLVAVARGRAVAGRAMRRAARLREPVVGPDRFCDGALVTLLGRLKVSGAGCLRLRDGQPAAACGIEGPRFGRRSQRAARLSVVVDGLAVELEGGVDLLRGSCEWRAYWPSGRVPGPIALRTARAGLDLGVGPHTSAVLRALAPGDTVRVAGRLRTRSGGPEDGGTLREPARRWAIEPDRADGAVLLACSSRPRLRRSWLLLARGAVVGAAAAFGLAVGVGEAAFARNRDLATRWSTDLDGYVIAAATPLRRADALEALHEAEFARGLRPDVDVALAQLPLYCELLAEEQLSAGFLEQAAQLARGCHSPEGATVEAQARHELGDLPAVSSAIAAGVQGFDDGTALRIHVLARRYRSAAAAARRLTAAGDSTGSPERQLPRCLADALEARAGDAAARGRLQQAAETPGPDHSACVVLMADLLEGQDRARFLDAYGTIFPAGGARHPSLVERLNSHLMLEADPRRGLATNADVYDDGSAGWTMRLQPSDRVLLEASPEDLVQAIQPALPGVPGLDRVVYERLAERVHADPRTLAFRARLAASLAMWASAAGQTVEARVLARGAIADLRELARWPRPRADVADALGEAEGLLAAIELRGGSLTVARSILAHVPGRAWFARALREAARVRGPAPPWPRLACMDSRDGETCRGERDPTELSETLRGRVVRDASVAPRRQLVAAALVAALGAGSGAPFERALARRERRRALRLRHALFARETAVILALLDGDLARQQPPDDTSSLFRGRLGGATELHTGWLHRHDASAHGVLLEAGRCYDLMVAREPWGSGLTVSLHRPSDGRTWDSRLRGGHQTIHVCSDLRETYRAQLQAAGASSWYVLAVTEAP